MNAVEPVLRDPKRSVAIIAGTYHYNPRSGFQDLAAVRNNVSDLARLLRDPEIWGLPTENCIELLQPTRDLLLSTINDKAVQATDTVVVYLAGHGFTEGAGQDYYLALEHTNTGSHETHAVRYESLRAVLRGERVKVTGKIVVIDACYSGRAADRAMADDIGRAINDKTKVNGAVTLVSTSRNGFSMAPRAHATPSSQPGFFRPSSTASREPENCSPSPISTPRSTTD